jgi:hypothetical protein
MENIQIPEIAEAIRKKFFNEIRDYARSRRNDVGRNAETPELAATLVDKFGTGLIQGARLIEFDVGPLRKELDRLVLDIDPDFVLNRQKRWAARPASISFGQP